MVSPNKDKEVVIDHSKLDRSKGFRRKRKPSSILYSKKFFLYFKNLSLQTKYESQLKAFGAEIVPYIDKEVNYVVTDCVGYNGKTRSLTEIVPAVSPQCYSVSPATSISGDDQNIAKRTRTRTEAMLERVSVQSHNISSLNNPISTALSWNIPVYSVDYFQNLLNKKLSQIQLSTSSETNNDKHVREFLKKYLKIEHICANKYRPEFKEIHRWPTIDTSSVLGCCPFDKSFRKSSRKEKPHNNDKKSDRMNRTCNKTANEAGYCEICTVHYTDLSQHVTTNSHLKFICNDKNYAELDNCIKTRSIEAFLATHSDDSNCAKESETNDDMGRNLKKSVSLHFNNNNENSSVSRSLNNAKLLSDDTLKQPLQVQCNGFTNYHLRKSSIKSDSVLMTSTPILNNKDLLLESRKMYASCPENNSALVKDLPQLSHLEEDSLHRLRSRKNLLLPSILLGTTAEDCNRSRNVLSPQTPTSNHFLRSSSSPKLPFGGGQYSTRSKLSFEDGYKKLNQTNSPTTNKQSTGLHFTRSKTISFVPYGSKPPSRDPSSPKDEPRMNGKSCRRKSSINVSDEDTKVNAASTSSRNVPSYQFSKKLRNNQLQELTDLNDRNFLHRKRMSVEEKFLEDNKEYYKVELLRTKLRSTEHFCSRDASPVDKRDDRKEPKGEDDEETGNSKLKRPRQSALHLLNLEATNFMFGPSKRDESGSSETEDEDSLHENGNKIDQDDENVNQQHPPYPEMKQNGRRVKGKKRRTHAEVFIHDNFDYYKFEISGSRLRHQNNEDLGTLVKTEADFKSTCSSSATDSRIPSSNFQSGAAAQIKEEALTDNKVEVMPVTRKRGKTKRNSFVEDTENMISAKEDSETEENDIENLCCDRPPPPSDSVRFAFESVPYKEPWFQAFQRFDQCDERYIPIPNTVYFSRYRDILSRNQIRKRNLDKSSGTSSPSKDSSALAHFRRKRKQRFGRHIINDKPRKSPRCHASTLAILSSLTGHRRRSRKLLTAIQSGPRKGNVANKHDLERKSLLFDINENYEAKLRELVNSVAKDVDYHFIEVFCNDDCGDAYLERINSNKVFLSTEYDQEDIPCCMQIDADIFHEKDLLKSLMTTENCIENMSEFLDSSLRCTSMETAQDEDLVIPRSHDVFSRLYREHDFSGNSSDCGASSTCEFLGFAEDGRTVSRKRKRKRPNMTGWPHDKSKRRHLRMLRLNNGDDTIGSEVDRNEDLKRKEFNTDASEAESDGTDDEVPLNEVFRKKRRTNNSLSAGEIDPKEHLRGNKKECHRNIGSSRKSSRTSVQTSNTSPQKLKPVARRKLATCSGRRNKFI